MQTIREREQSVKPQLGRPSVGLDLPMVRFSVHINGGTEMSDQDYGKWFLSLSPEVQKMVSEARDLKWELAAIQGKGR